MLPPYYRVEALASLIPHLSPEWRWETLYEALTIAGKIGDAEDRIRCLSSLIMHISSGDLVTKAKNIVMETKDKRWRTIGLAIIASSSPLNDQEPDALHLLDAIRDLPVMLDEDEFYFWSPRANALIALAPYLPLELLPQALVIACGIEVGYLGSEYPSMLNESLSEDFRYEALTALARRLDRPPSYELYTFFEKSLHLLSSHNRWDFLFAIRALAPVIHTLGGKIYCQSVSGD